MEVTKGLSAHIKSERKKRGWSQDDLAKIVGKSRPTISNLENGATKRAHNETIQAILGLFDETVAELEVSLKFEKDAWDLLVDRVQSLKEVVEDGRLDPGGALFLAWTPIETMAEERGVPTLEERNTKVEEWNDRKRRESGTRDQASPDSSNDTNPQPPSKGNDDISIP